jgi:hypothetical protein
MTAITDIKAVTPTANAKAVVAAKGTDITALMAAVLLKASELKVLVAQVIAVHPSGGGDAANLTALNSILAELA